MIDDETLTEIAANLVGVDGVVGVMLGGSRARGEHSPDSDFDLGIYYRPPLDVTALGDLARNIGGRGARVTQPGEWGPWVDGGGWLNVDGVSLDWIYRDIDRVHAAWRRAQAGEYRFHFQVGHPLGFPDFAYAGEIALGAVLNDPSGELSALHHAAADYPAALRDALVSGLDEAAFIIDCAQKTVRRGDATYVAGCLFRAVGICAQAIHAHAGRWMLNEKGAVAAAGRIPGSPPDFASRAHNIFAGVGTEPEQLVTAINGARDLVRATIESCRPTNRTSNDISTDQCVHRVVSTESANTNRRGE